MKMEEDPTSPVGYAAIQEGDDVLLVVNLGQLNGQPAWMREFIGNEVLRQVEQRRYPNLADVIYLQEVRTARTALEARL